MIKLLLTILPIFGLVITVPGQNRQRRPNNKDVRISRAHLTVYITFVKTGKREPIYTSDSDEGIWLRLHNNTRWALVLAADGSPSVAKGKEKEIGMFYGIEEIPKMREIVAGPIAGPPPLPPANQGIILPPSAQPSTGKDSDAGKDKYQECGPTFGHWCHLCMSIKLQPGKSLLFSIPREHLCRSHKLYLKYRYEWEGDGQEPEHRVYFYGTNLPKGVR